VLKAVTKLQGYTTLLSEQTAIFSRLSARLCEYVPVQGPLSEEQLASLDVNQYVVSGSYAARLDEARKFIDDLGLFVLGELKEIEDADVKTVEESVAQLFADLIAGIATVCAERESNNLASQQLLPAVTPQGLVLMRCAEFSSILLRFKARLYRNGFEERDLDALEEEFAGLLAAYRDEPALQRTIRRLSSTYQFEESWAPIDQRFPLLQEFCGGVASVFPNTARVEADFSTIKREKNPQRMGLSDFSLEGILHATQFDSMQELQ
jgi:hypothetical protein